MIYNTEKTFPGLLAIHSAKDIIQQLRPVVIPRISGVAHMALCERAAYNIDFLGMHLGDFSASGEIGNAVHRVVIKSTLEITDSIKKANGCLPISKSKAIDLFRINATDDVDINWKRFVLAGIEKPLPAIMEDLDIRAERLVNQLLLPSTDDDNNNGIISNRKEVLGGSGETEEQEGGGNDRYDTLLLRPEFTIRNLEIPLEGRLDLVKIKIADKLVPRSAEKYYEAKINSSSSSWQPVSQKKKKNTYVTSDRLANLKIKDVEIIQIKTGKARPRNASWNLQADAEALLLMKALNLQKPPRYTWQFADKDAQRKKFDFTRVYCVVDRFIGLWKSEVSPDITGYCPNCPLREGCLEWSFAAKYKLTQEEQARRRAEFNTSKRIREEISYVDRWKVYVSSRNPSQRQQEGSAITNLKIDMKNIDLKKQEIKLLLSNGNDEDGNDNVRADMSNEIEHNHNHNLIQQHQKEEKEDQFVFLNNFIDFGIGDYVTISDGNPNLGSNPTAIITEIDIDNRSITLQLYRNDIYFLIYENRHNILLTIDRFGFSGLKTIEYLDDFFRHSPYADMILQRSGFASQS